MAEEGSSSMDSDICHLCNTNKSKYCCPRCNILYCSLVCYKSNQHIACSESFYKDCVEQEVKSITPDSTAKNQMLEILSRTYRNDCNSKDENILNSDSENESINDSNDSEDAPDSDDDDSLPDLVERMRDINLDDAERVWDALSSNEKRDFEELIKSEDVTKILSIWEPWWKNHQEEQKVEEILECVKKEPFIENCPKILKDVKSFSSISSKPPAPCVKHNLLNVLSSYVYVVRLFNGEHHFFDREAVCCLHSICKNLNSNENFEDGSVAVLSVVQECFNNPSIITDSETKKLIMQDLQCVLRGPSKQNKSFYILSSLSDLHALLTQAKIKHNEATANSCNKIAVLGEFAKKFVEHDMLELPQPTKGEILNYLRKIEYYLSYVKAFGDDASSSVLIML